MTGLSQVVAITRLTLRALTQRLGTSLTNSQTQTGPSANSISISSVTSAVRPGRISGLSP